MRLLHIFPSFGLGGQQARLAALARGLGPGFSHQIISLDGDLSAAASFSGPVETSALVLKKTGALDAGNLRRLIATLRASGAGILCTHNFGSLEAAAANRLGPMLPHIHQEDGFGPDETPSRQKMRRVLFRRFVLQGSTTVLPSLVLENVARRVWKLPPQRVRYIPNGIELTRFAQSARARSGPVTVGTVGAFRSEKNYARLIRCFREAAIPSAGLELVGDGPEFAALRTAAAELGDRAVFPGRMAAPEEAYARFDIFALSSDTEQMPLSLMEAMAAGLPVVATDVGDILEMVSPVNRPFVVPPDDEKGFAQSLATLAADETLRHSIGEANRRLAAERFGADAMIAAYRSLYVDVAMSKRRDSAAAAP